MNWILSKLLLFVAWVAHTLDNDYLRKCIDNFYNTVGRQGYGYELEHHWYWIKLPMVKEVHPDKLAMNMMKTEPLDAPSGMSFNIIYGDEEE